MIDRVTVIQPNGKKIKGKVEITDSTINVYKRNMSVWLLVNILLYVFLLMFIVSRGAKYGDSRLAAYMIGYTIGYYAIPGVIVIVIIELIGLRMATAYAKERVLCLKINEITCNKKVSHSSGKVADEIEMSNGDRYLFVFAKKYETSDYLETVICEGRKEDSFYMEE